MPNFKYKAVNSEGNTIESVLLAADKEDVLRELKDLKMIVISVTEVKSKEDTGKLKFNIKDAVIINFTKQLYTLMKAGIPIIGSLKALREQAVDENFKKIVENITRDIEGGSKLSDALGQYPKVFPAIYINSIKIGEISGTLEETLYYVYNYIEEDSRMRKDVKKAFRYPTFVIIGLIAAFVVFTTTVIPAFLPMFEKSGVELPMPTKILIGINYVISNYGLLVLGILIVTIGGLVYYIRTPEGRLKKDLFMLKIPIMGEFVKKVNIARFAKLFYTMNRTGVSITKSFEIMQETMGNEVYNKELKIIADKITKGEDIAGSLKQSPFFTNLVVEMISIGEKSGSLDDMLLSVSDYYNREVSETVENLTSLIEPIITVGLGGMILLLALGLFMPMWDMMSLM